VTSAYDTNINQSARERILGKSPKQAWVFSPVGLEIKLNMKLVVIDGSHQGFPASKFFQQRNWPENSGLSLGITFDC